MILEEALNLTMIDDLKKLDKRVVLNVIEYLGKSETARQELIAYKVIYDNI